MAFPTLPALTATLKANLKTSGIRKLLELGNFCNLVQPDDARRDTGEKSQ